MPEPVEWGADGTPHSARFGDRYRSATGGLAQARHVFLDGCGLPGAWAGHSRWTILETGFGLGLNFLTAWHAWKDDPRRPRILHFVSIEAFPVAAGDVLRSAEAHPELLPLAGELAAQGFGLLPGFHRMAFEGGRVLLTLCVGDVQDMLRQLAFQADSVFLDGFDIRVNPAMWEPAVLKGVSRLSHRGTGIATWTVAGEVRRGLAQSGFRVARAEGLPPKRDCLRGVFDPAWEPKALSDRAEVEPGRCAVIGAGLAGAAVAASLARRGWQVDVFDAADRPAAGASALPAGLLAPNQSPDDNVLSRLSRAGVRMTLQQCAQLLGEDDWGLTGVLEKRIGDERAPPHESEWTRRAGADWWHEKAAWIRPGALVQAWLGEAGVAFHPGQRVTPGGEAVKSAGLVVVAAAHEGHDWFGGRIALNPVRGQVSWSRQLPSSAPRFPVNGNGHFVMTGTRWLCGSTYGRGETALEVRAADHAANLERLRVLLPEVAAELAPQFDRGEVQGWTGVRCTSTDRRPIVGEAAPGVWTSTAMGSRGLTFCVLAAELLAAQVHGEPWPVERKLGEALSPARFPAP